MLPDVAVRKVLINFELGKYEGILKGIEFYDSDNN
jgi:hypothetical protein